MSENSDFRFIRYVEVCFSKSVIENESMDSFLRSIYGNVEVLTDENMIKIRGSYAETSRISESLSKYLENDDKRKCNPPSREARACRTNGNGFVEPNDQTDNTGGNNRSGGSRKRGGGPTSPVYGGKKTRMSSPATESQISSPFEHLTFESPMSSSLRASDRLAVGRRLSDEFRKLSTSFAKVSRAENSCKYTTQSSSTVATFRSYVASADEPQAMIPGQTTVHHRTPGFNVDEYVRMHSSFSGEDRMASRDGVDVNMRREDDNDFESFVVIPDHSLSGQMMTSHDHSILDLDDHKSDL